MYLGLTRQISLCGPFYDKQAARTFITTMKIVLREFVPAPDVSKWRTKIAISYSEA